MQSCQSLHCSRTYTKWVCLWHILSVNVQTSLSMRAVSPEPSLLSHMRKMGLHTSYSFSQCSDKPYCVCSLARAFTALAHAQNGRTYDIFFSQCSKGDLVCMQSCQSIHCARTYTKWVCLWHLLSVNAQTSLSMCAVLPEHSLRSHIHKMGAFMASFISQWSNKP